MQMWVRPKGVYICKCRCGSDLRGSTSARVGFRIVAHMRRVPDASCPKGHLKRSWAPRVPSLSSIRAHTHKTSLGAIRVMLGLLGVSFADVRLLQMWVIGSGATSVHLGVRSECLMLHVPRVTISRGHGHHVYLVLAASERIHTKPGASGKSE
jgi:hypothetical protein